MRLALAQQGAHSAGGGNEHEVEQAVPGLTTQHWLEWHNTLLLWQGNPADEPQPAQCKALRKIRRRLADAMVWMVNAWTELSHDTLDTISRQLHKQFHLMGQEIPQWLWEIHQPEWDQPGLPAQGIGFISASGVISEDVNQSLAAQDKLANARRDEIDWVLSDSQHATDKSLFISNPLVF